MVGGGLAILDKEHYYTQKLKKVKVDLEPDPW